MWKHSINNNKYVDLVVSKNRLYGFTGLFKHKDITDLIVDITPINLTGGMTGKDLLRTLLIDANFGGIWSFFFGGFSSRASFEGMFEIEIQEEDGEDGEDRKGTHIIEIYTDLKEVLIFLLNKQQELEESLQRKKEQTKAKEESLRAKEEELEEERREHYAG